MYKRRMTYRFFAASEKRAKELACNYLSMIGTVDPGDLYVIGYANCPTVYHEGRAYLEGRGAEDPRLQPGDVEPRSALE